MNGGPRRGATGDARPTAPGLQGPGLDTHRGPQRFVCAPLPAWETSRSASWALVMAGHGAAACRARAWGRPPLRLPLGGRCTPLSPRSPWPGLSFPEPWALPSSPWGGDGRRFQVGGARGDLVDIPSPLAPPAASTPGTEAKQARKSGWAGEWETEPSRIGGPGGRRRKGLASHFTFARWSPRWELHLGAEGRGAGGSGYSPVGSDLQLRGRRGADGA